MASAPSTATQSRGESVLTFGVRDNAGFVTLAAGWLGPTEVKALLDHVGDLGQRVGGNMVLDVAGVQPFDCTWINALIGLTVRCKRMGGRLVLVGVSDDANDIIRSTGLTKMLDVGVSRESALAELQRSGSGGLLDRIKGRTKAA